MVGRDKTRIPELERKKLAQIPLSKLVKSIIFGSVLGDGSLLINDGYKNAVFTFRHSIKQSEYFHWKSNALNEISSSCSVHLQDADGYSKNQKLIFKSKALEQLTEIYNVLKKKKTIDNKKEVIKSLNSSFFSNLMMWWWNFN